MSDNQHFTPSFEDKIYSFITKHQLLSISKRYLVGVSGGPDSTALVFYLKNKGFQFDIAHCNYQLRGIDANEEEQFVSTLAKRIKVGFHFSRFETEKEKVKGESIQMVARRLRFSFFETLIKNGNYDGVLLGTNLNDQLETALLNLTKGTGISGLTGIKPKNGNILRPFIEASKEEILNYLHSLNESYRIDASNQENKYQRNLIRNAVVPQLEKINPNILSSFSKSLNHLQHDEMAIQYAVDLAKRNCVTQKGEQLEIEIEKLKTYPFYPKIVWSITSELGFSSDQTKEVLKLLEGPTGKEVNAKGWICLKDRAHLTFYPNQKTKGVAIKIDEIPITNKLISIKEAQKPETLKSPSNTIYLEEKTLQFPLLLRNWEQGDKLKPFGMKGQKLVSDVLIDQKISKLEKDNQLVLVNGDGRIIWVLGLKFSEEFKVSTTAEKVLWVEFE